MAGPNLPPRAPPRLMVESPRRAAHPGAVEPDETEVNYGTFYQRDFPVMTENSKGYWWRKRLTERAIVSNTQAEKRYNRIPCNPTLPKALFLTSRENQRIPVENHGRMLLNEYLA